MAAITITPTQPRKAMVMATEWGELISALVPNETYASRNTPPAAAIHSMAMAKNMPK